MSRRLVDAIQEATGSPVSDQELRGGEGAQSPDELAGQPSPRSITTPRASYRAVPFSEPEGHTTWAVSEEVYGPNYYRRQLVSFHPTRPDAEAACEAFRGLDTATSPKSPPASDVANSADAGGGV